MKNKVKIGEVEFTMPFERVGFVVEDARRNYICDLMNSEYGESNDNAINEIIATALNAHFARQWVSVKDGLPEKAGNYFVTYKGNGNIDVGELHFNGKEWCWSESGCELVYAWVLAWQMRGCLSRMRGNE